MDEPLFDSKFLDRCFFIIDEETYQFDEGEEDLMILYFYPKTVDKAAQIYLLGACQAMQRFVEIFTKDPVSVLALEKHRLAFQHIGKLIMVLSSPISESCTALQQRLSRVANWFRFVYGTYDMVRGPCGDDRRKFIERFNEIGALLTEPFDIEEEFSAGAGLTGIFQPIRFAELPSFLGSRIFSGANQMLWDALCADEGALAGCVICDQLVLCTQFDVPTTDTVVIRSNFVTRSNPGPKHWEYVYLTRSQVETLKKLGCAAGDDDEDEEDEEDEDDNESGHKEEEEEEEVNDKKDNVTAKVDEEEEDDDDKEVPILKVSDDAKKVEINSKEGEEEEELVKCVLCVFVHDHVCMSLLLSLEGDEGEDDAKVSARVDAIYDGEGVAKGLVVFNETLNYAKSLSSKSGASSGTLSSVFGDQTPRLGLSQGSVGGPSSSPTPQSGSSSNMIVPIQWALYDSLTGSIKQNQCPVQLTQAQLNSFHDMVALAHDTLALPGVTQVYLRRSNGSILSKDLFSKQLHWFTHYHITGHERFTEFFEKSRNDAFKNSPDGQMF